MKPVANSNIKRLRRAKARRRAEPVADRNQRWLRLTTDQGITPLQIADREVFSLRTVQLGIQKAKTQHAKPPEPPPLSAAELGYVAKLYGADPRFHTAEVRDFLESQRARRRA